MKKKLYKKLVFYIEACESGSMVEHLLTEDLGIYVVTASNSTESSYATYCGPPYDTINGVSLDNCLGDLFSVKWMENTDTITNNSESLNEQYAIVQKETYQSHVLQFGDKTFTGDPVKEFLGSENSSYVKNLKNYLFSYFNSASQMNEKLKQFLEEAKIKGSMNSRDVEHNMLQRKMSEDPLNPVIQALHQEVDNKRNLVDTIFYQFRSKYQIPSNIKNNSYYNEPVNKCYKEIIGFYMSNWAVDKDYSLGFYKYFYSVCSQEAKMEDMKTDLIKYCTPEKSN